MLGTLQEDCQGKEEASTLVRRVLAELERVTNESRKRDHVHYGASLSQTTPTEQPAASGTCSTATVGDNNSFNINCNGMV